MTTKTINLNNIDLTIVTPDNLSKYNEEVTTIVLDMIAFLRELGEHSLKFRNYADKIDVLYRETIYHREHGNPNACKLRAADLNNKLNLAYRAIARIN